MVDKKLSRFLLLAFFLSGLAVLIYEIVWARKLGLIFGTTTYAISTVLAVFFTGLALGSFIFGKLVDKYQRPLLTYALLELGIGIYALFTPQIFELIKSLQASFWQRFTPTYFGFSLFTFLLSAAGLIIPTILMGGTLPAISKFFVTQRETLGEKISLLYAVNTAGAILGVILAGFFLIILLGVNGAIYFAALINILIGIVAFGLSRIETNDRRIQANKNLRLSSENLVSSLALGNERIEKIRFAQISILLVYAASGFAALALEVLWTRVLVMILGSSTYAFSIMLATFLFGITVGSAVISKFIDRKENVLPYFVATQILIGLFVILSIPAFDRLPLLFFKILDRTRGQFWVLQLAEFLFCSLVMLIPTFLMGAAFPIVVKAYKVRGLGSRVGEVYGANTLGGVLGSIAAGFLFVPIFGIQRSILIAGLVYFAVGIVILFLLPARRKVKLLTIVVVLMVCGLGIVARPWNKNILSSGVFIYGDLHLGPQATEIIFYKEGLSATVAVRRVLEDKTLFLQINGKTDASSKGDLPTELLSGHLSMLFHPNPQQILVIGLGSGITLGAVEQYQEFEEIDAIEIEPAVIEAAKLFSPYHNNALDDPRLNMIVGDARNYLSATDKKYDVITAEPSNLWIAGMGNLFAKEHFEMIKARLKEGGVVLQWVHLYRISEEDLRTVIKTFQSVFPKMTVWTTEPEMRDLLLIGFTNKEKIDLALVKERFRQEKIKNSLSKVGINSPNQLFGYFLLDSQAAKEFAHGASFHTDNYPTLEFSTPKSFYTKTIGLNLASLKEFQSLPFEILSELDPEAKADLEREFAIRKNLIEAEIHFGKEKYQEAASFLEEALTLDSSREEIRKRLADVYFEVGKGLFRKGQNEEAVEYFQKIVELDPENAEAYKKLGEVYLKAGGMGQWTQMETIEEGRKMLEKSLELNDLDPITHRSLGVAYGMLKMEQEAEREFKRALELNPRDDIAHNNLGYLYQLQGEIDKAREEWQESLRINSQQPQVQESLRLIRE